MIEFINRFRSKYFLLLLVVSVSFISTNSEASSFYWRNGTDVGSSFYWRNGTDVGSSFYWRNGTDVGSRFYWRNGTDVGSSFYWRNGTDSSFWENQMIFVCMGLIDDNKDGLPEICEGYELK
jgi:hypothetical protein